MFQRMRWPELAGWRIWGSDSAVCMVADDGNGVPAAGANALPAQERYLFEMRGTV